MPQGQWVYYVDWSVWYVLMDNPDIVGTSFDMCDVDAWTKSIYNQNAFSLSISMIK